MITPCYLSPLIKEIILANKLDEESEKLVWSSSHRYKIYCGPDDQFVLKYKDGKPYVILDKEPDS